MRARDGYLIIEGILTIIAFMCKFRSITVQVPGCSFTKMQFLGTDEVGSKMTMFTWEYYLLCSWRMDDSNKVMVRPSIFRTEYLRSQNSAFLVPDRPLNAF